MRIHNNSVENIVGVTYEIVLVLAAKLNFTPNFIVGNKNVSESGWSALCKKVADGEVDIGANGYRRTADRIGMVEFSVSFYLEEVGMLVKKTSEDHKYLFLAPFTWDVS